jgi:hypothetical protein
MEDEMGMMCGVKVCGEESIEGFHRKDLGIGWRIVVKWICKKQNGVVWTGLIWLGSRRLL